MFQRKRKLPRTPLERLQDKLHDFIMVLWACRGMILVGFSASAAGNVLHAISNQAPQDQPVGVRVAIALAAPIMLFGAFEAMSRIPLPPRGMPWYSLRYAGTFLRILGMNAIVTVTVVTSYRHQRSALELYGGDVLQAQMLPGAIDAFMLVGSLSVIEVMIFIRLTEDKIAALENLEMAKQKDNVVPQDRPLNGRQKIALAMMQLPHDATAREIAAEAGTTVPYTSTVVSEIRKAQRASNNGGAVAS
jgi:hypothetical protein